MGGRGSRAAGKNAPDTYKTVGTFHGIKVLEGIGGKHNLPEEARTSSAFAKLHKDGNLQMLRFYDKEGFLTVKIGFHPEPDLTGHRRPVYYIHEYKRDNFTDRKPRLFTKDDLEKYGKCLTKEGCLK